MPQIWLSYHELAAFLGCAVEDARPAAIDGGWSRRRCHDGLTRVKLPSSEAGRYMRRCVEASVEIDRQVASLRAVLDEAHHGMTVPEWPERDLPILSEMPRARRAG